MLESQKCHDVTDGRPAKSSETQQKTSEMSNTDKLRPQRLGVQELLGPDGLERYESFKQLNSAQGSSKPLSQLSVAVMSTFASYLRQVNFEPSLFMTDAGNMELGWEDAEGGAVELEFFADRIEYYIERRDLEGAVGLADLGILIDLLEPF